MRFPNAHVYCSFAARVSFYIFNKGKSFVSAQLILFGMLFVCCCLVCWYKKKHFEGSGEDINI